MEKHFTSDTILNKIKEMIYEESGIIFTASYMKVLDQRVQSVCKESGCEPADILEYISKDVEYLREFVGHVTTNHTHFFRSIGQYNVLENILLPQIVEKNAKTKRIRIWSAACASGEEPYTIMMVVQNFFEKHGLIDWACHVLASDIDGVSLRKGEKGEYSVLGLRHIPEHYHKYLHLDMNSTDPNIRDFFRVSPLLKRNVFFKYNNLIKDTLTDNFDIIFCRNVLIYFDLEMQQKVIGHLLKVLKPGGFLFISPSETLNGISDGLTMVMTPESAYYVRQG